jgi:hypothetical protein
MVRRIRPKPGRLFSSLALFLAKTLGVLSFTPLTMLRACAQAVDFKVGHYFGEGQAKYRLVIRINWLDVMRSLDCSSNYHGMSPVREVDARATGRAFAPQRHARRPRPEWSRTRKLSSEQIFPAASWKVVEKSAYPQ